MKKLGLILVVLMLVAGTNYAQRGGGQRPSQAAGQGQGRPSTQGAQGAQGMQGGQGRQNMTPEEMVKSQTKRLVDELKLNKDQEAKITAIYKKSSTNTTDFQKMRDASEAERTKMMETMQKARDQQTKDIKAVLTPAQLKTYEESLKNRQNGQGRMGGQGGFGGQGGQNMDPAAMAKMQTQRLVEELKLNKDQETKLTAINTKYSGKSTMDFTKMRDASDAERTKMREDMQKVNAEKEKEIKAILTPAQLKTYEESLKNRQSRQGQGRMGGGQGGFGGQ